MKPTAAIDALDHPGIIAWFERALHDGEPLPKLTPDESPYIGILRVDKEATAATRASLREGCNLLLNRFCERGEGEPFYLRQLISLTAEFNRTETHSKQWETSQRLAELATRFPELPSVGLDVRQAVIGALVDMLPPQPSAYWKNIFSQDPAHYGALVVAGVMATYPYLALELLPEMPDDESDGQITAINLDLAWDDLSPAEQSKFGRRLRLVLAQCGKHFATPLQVWADSKEIPEAVSGANASLHEGIAGILSDSVARVLTPKLCAMGHC